MAELERQMQAVNTQRVEYVTVLMGANDVCASSEAAMTPVAEFRAQFERAMNTVTAGSPSALVCVVSIPDVYRLWLILHENPNTRPVWRLTGFCRSMLARPGSTAPEDEARRQRVRQREIEYNAVLAQVCAVYVRCRFDGNAVFNYPFQPRHVSTRDYFHPSLEGQRVLAQLERARGRLCQAAIEREARRGLDDGLVARLEGLGFLRAADTKVARAEVSELAAAVAAVEELQAWVERRLYAAREGLTLSAE